MNFDVIENLKEDEVMSLYNEVIELNTELGWCKCNTNEIGCLYIPYGPTECTNFGSGIWGCYFKGLGYTRLSMEGNCEFQAIEAGKVFGFTLNKSNPNCGWCS